MAARTKYVLIDYENVQPSDLAKLRGGPYKVKVFIGANQAKIPVGLAAGLQRLGANAEYVLLQSSGSNALDFHIAYYVGTLSAQDPSAFFHVISKDTGFDPLIEHLKTKGLFVQRSASISAASDFNPTGPSSTTDEQIDLVITHLAKLKAAKPRAEKTLLNTLNTLFKKELSEHQLSDLFALLRKRGYVKVDGTKVSYELPSAD